MKTKFITIFSHVAGWIIFFSLLVGFLANQQSSGTIISQLLSVPFLVFYAVFLFIFYFNMAVLIPQLYLKKKYVLYFIAVIGLFAAVYFIKPFDGLMQLNPPPGDMRMRPPQEVLKEHFEREGPGAPSRAVDITSIILFVTVWSFSTALCIIRQWRMTEQRALIAETDKVNAELSFLKSQVNPHFLFNTLNNIYSLAITKNENTAPSIMKLSNIMRYVTDEAGQNFVPLEDEVECMKDYIDLQRMRLGEKMSIDLLVKGNMIDKKIPPLLLMTFVENVFKYGISSHEASNIIIKLTADDHNITFFCQNKLFETKRNTERTGIGIPNARKRLEHLYPNKYFLDIAAENGTFTVQLTLQA